MWDPDLNMILIRSRFYQQPTSMYEYLYLSPNTKIQVLIFNEWFILADWLITGLDNGLVPNRHQAII